MTTQLKLKMEGPESKAQKGAQGKGLAFSPKTKKRVKNILKRYPAEQKQSAVIPVLKLAQDEFDGWLSLDAMKLVAEALDMPYIRVYEVATFYTMFNLEPVGKYHVQVCTNCSCMIRGAESIAKVAKDEAGVEKSGQMSGDEMFTVTEVECLGACVEAPMMQINDNYHTKLTEDSAREILQKLRAGQKVEGVTPTPEMKDRY